MFALYLILTQCNSSGLVEIQRYINCSGNNRGKSQIQRCFGKIEINRHKQTKQVENGRAGIPVSQLYHYKGGEP